MGRRAWQWAAAGVGAPAVLVLAILMTTSEDRRPSSSSAEGGPGGGIAEQEPGPLVTAAPEPSTATTLRGVPPTTTATTPTTAAPVRTTTTPTAPEATVAPVTPVPKVRGAPATWSGAMNGISLRMRVEPGIVLGGREGVGFALEMSSATPGCCRASVRFSDGVKMGVLPTLTCPSTTTDTSAAITRRFAAAGAYTTTLVASTCPTVISLTGPNPQVTAETAELVVYLRVVLDGSGSTSSSAGPCP